MNYEQLLNEVQSLYRSGDFKVSYQDIADRAGCSKMNVAFVIRGRHKNSDVLVAAARLFAEKKRAIRDAATAIAAA